jgi:hypothetical protein
LRNGQATDPSLSGFALPAEPSAPAGARSVWRKADLKRALAIAEEAGLRAYRVEIAPDGTIAIIVDRGNEASG